MMNGFSVRKSAQICGIHRNTAFAWRHKLLDCLQRLAEQTKLDGIIEADKTFFRFSRNKNIQLIQLKSGKEKRGIYNIQKINNYHSKLKRFMNTFNGVSTKYLNNYLVWHTWFDMKGHSQLEKADLFLAKAVAVAMSVKHRKLSSRPAIPLSA